MRISGLPFGKWFDGVLAVFCSLCILATVSSIFIGFDLTIGNIRSREIRLNAAEVKITGKAYDPSVRIVGGKEVINADCRMGMSSNCIFHPVGQKYQNSNQDVWIPFSAK